MNCITKFIRRKEIKQCEELGVDLSLSRRTYDKRKLKPLYFTKDFVVASAILYLAGEEYSPYNFNYGRMINMVKEGYLTQKK